MNLKKVTDNIQKGMTNETPKLVIGTGISLATAAASYADKMEQYLRMGASLVAIASGLVVIYFAVKNHNKKQQP